MSTICKVENLRLKYPGNEGLVFKDFTLPINQGEKVLLIGPSGCGKSTLLQVMAGIIPHSYEIPMKAETIQTPESWGYIFQDPDSQFCMPYADEELAFVLENLNVQPETMQQRIHELLNSVGLSLNDIHHEINSMSGGMKQRLAIASALALEPEVLFLDEPTAMLDQQGTEDIWKTIHNAAVGKTMVIVEHRLEHVWDLVDRVIMLSDDGTIAAEGPPHSLLLDHKETMMEQGIWYPGAWSDYLSEKEKSSHLPANKEVISLNEFRGFYGKEERISIPHASVMKGDWISIIGKNGAGKSTLLHSLMKLIPTKGKYMINGKAAGKTDDLTQDITFVFQNPEHQFVSHTVYDEIAYTLRVRGEAEEEVKERVEEMLDMFHLNGCRSQHPYQLSMGQKRRLSVAAAIVSQPGIVLLDEPTFGQDAKNTFAILEMMEHWRRQGTTIMMITHEPEIIENYSTKVWEIKDGELVKEDVHLNLIDPSEVIYHA
ncbi:ABC transporter ATP-binding protein [Falsibacillus pallidus]|uniref:Energy-coupling factor transport system ATP-binding protein n=1 Tax=Falsibacillus pallidus TaxID=493781 RepID=A0A370G9M7_9BACI|nr:ABC transporter ATP-binding protein [Falsibacillus pallidus]RDI39910.1 energy-coupling factor transport system ATP-binding protein [Falsibacillus pallidus]